MEIRSIHLNLHCKIKPHVIGYGDVFGMGGITGKRIARISGKL